MIEVIIDITVNTSNNLATLGSMRSIAIFTLIAPHRMNMNRVNKLAIMYVTIRE